MKEILSEESTQERRAGPRAWRTTHTHENPTTGKLLLLRPLVAHLRLDQASLGSERWRVHSSLD